MSSPYRVGAIVSALSQLPPGSTALSDAEYQDLLDILDLKEEILSGFPIKIYEPYMIQGELVTVASGDLLLGWGGKYAS